MGATPTDLPPARRAPPAPGVIVATNKQAVGSAIDDSYLIATRMSEAEIADRVIVYLPFRE